MICGHLSGLYKIHKKCGPVPSERKQRQLITLWDESESFSNELMISISLSSIKKDDTCLVMKS